jgi:hypothetical protein
MSESNDYVVIRPAGCRTVYQISFEDIDEQVYEPQLTRSEAERLHHVLGLMLNNGNGNPPVPAPLVPLPFTPQPPWVQPWMPFNVTWRG